MNRRQRRKLKAEARNASRVVAPAVEAFAAGAQMSRALDEARDALAVIEDLGDEEQVARARRLVTEAEAGLVEHYGHIEGYAASIGRLAR